MNKLIPLTAVVFATAATSTSASIAFTTGTGTYDDSDVVIVPTANVMQDNATNFYIREPRATLQTFQVDAAVEIEAINIIVRRAVQDSTFTLSLREFATQANFYTPADVAATSLLATFNAAVTSEQAFGQTSGGIDATLDPATTMTWTLPSSVNLDTGKVYGLIVDGTSSSTEPLVYQLSLGNAYTGGLGYLQDFSSSENFRSGNSYFGGSGNDQQADWSLALVAVPEPSTYALLLGFVALGGVLLRRRRS